MVNKNVHFVVLLLLQWQCFKMKWEGFGRGFVTLAKGERLLAGLASVSGLISFLGWFWVACAGH